MRAVCAMLAGVSLCVGGCVRVLELDGVSNMLTAGGPTSIDQVVADHIRDGALVTPDDDPLNAWTPLFGEVGDDRTQGYRQSVLDIASA